MIIKCSRVLKDSQKNNLKTVANEHDKEKHQEMYTYQEER